MLKKSLQLATLISIYQKLLNSLTLNFVTTNSPFKDAFDDAKDFRDADQDI